MGEILFRNLQGKVIVGTDGTTFGTLDTVTTDPTAGTLDNLMVLPDDQPSSSAAVDTDGRLRIPISTVKTVSDQIVIETDEGIDPH